MAENRGGGVGKAVGIGLGGLGLLFARTADDCARLGAGSARIAGESAAVGKGLGALETGARASKVGVGEVGALRVGAQAADEGLDVTRIGLRAADEGLGGLPKALNAAGEVGALKQGASLEERLLEELPDLAVEVTSYLLDGDTESPPEPGGALPPAAAPPPFRLFGRAALVPLERGPSTEASLKPPLVLSPPSSPDDLLTRVTQNKPNAPLTVLARRAAGAEGRWRLGAGEVEGNAFFRQCDRWSVLCAALVCDAEAPAGCEGAALGAFREAAAPLATALMPAEVEAQVGRFVSALLSARASRPELAGLTLLRLARDQNGRGYVVRVSPKSPEPPAPAASAPSPKRPKPKAGAR